MKRNPDTGSESSGDAELLNPTTQAEGGDLEQVLRYVGLRWPVLRVNPNQKRPLERGWQKKASSDPAQLRAWFGVDHQFNVGVLTGRPSGFFVLDTDPRNGGDDSFDALQRRIGRFPDTVMQQTPGGGWHYLFRMPADRDVRCGTLHEYPGIDIKGTGGFVLAAPSQIDGRSYVWEESAKPGELPLAEAPEALLQFIAKPRRGTRTESVETIPEGQRNDTLASHAGTLRRLGWTEGEIIPALLAMNQRRCQPPLVEREVESIAHSICGYAPGPFACSGETIRPEEFNYTDLGNAERLIAYHGQDLRFCAKKEEWLAWDGRLWVPNPGARVLQMSADTVRRMYAEATRFEDGEARGKHASHATKSERADRLKAMVWLASQQESIAIDPGALDSDPYLINVQNGTLDLRTLELRQHRREDLITRIAAVVYDPTASCPVWLKFLGDIFDGDQEMIRYLQRAAGLCLSGESRLRVFFILFGTGHNGKSTFLETLRDALAEYAGTVPPSELMQVYRKDHGRASPFLVQLPGKRFVTAVETEENECLAASLIKTMTGGRDTIAVRGLYAKPFLFRPEFKLWIATNHRPRISDSTSSIWGRVHMVPFRVYIPDPERGEKADAKGRIKDPKLDPKLQAELPGIFAWMVAGWRDYRQHGLKPPAEVQDATRQYRQREDTVGQFIEECLEFGEGFESPAHALRAELQLWCTKSGESVQWRAVADRLTDWAGVAHSRPGRVRGWTGVRVLGKEGV